MHPGKVNKMPDNIFEAFVHRLKIQFGWLISFKRIGRGGPNTSGQPLLISEDLRQGLLFFKIKDFAEFQQDDQAVLQTYNTLEKS